MGDVRDEVAAEIFEFAHFREEFFFCVAFCGDACDAFFIAASEEDEHKDDAGPRAAGGDEAPAGEVARIGDGLVGDGDADDVIADAASVVEGCDVEGFGFAEDGASVAIAEDGFDFCAVCVGGEVCADGIVDDAACHIDEADANVFCDCFDAIAEVSGLAPEDEAREREADEGEDGRKDGGERAFHGG